MKIIKYLTAFFLFWLFTNCVADYRKNQNLETIVLTLDSSKSSEKTIIILVELDSKKIMILDTGLNSLIHVPPPPNSNNIYNFEEEGILIETMKITETDVQQLREFVSKFSPEDFQNKQEIVYDGIGLSMNFLYSNNEIKRVELINHFSETQIIFLRKIFNLVNKKSVIAKNKEKFRYFLDSKSSLR